MLDAVDYFGDNIHGVELLAHHCFCYTGIERIGNLFFVEGGGNQAAHLFYHQQSFVFRGLAQDEPPPDDRTGIRIRIRLRADGNDLSFVTVTVLDRAGVAVPTADQVIRFRLGGDARIIGVDNGDQISHAPFQADHVRLFNGKALVIVRAGERPGTVTLTAEGEGLAPAAVQITSRR